LDGMNVDLLVRLSFFPFWGGTSKLKRFIMENSFGKMSFNSNTMCLTYIYTI
jgi:hypothetical protein